MTDGGGESDIAVVMCSVHSVKDFRSSVSVLQRPDFVFMDDYLAEGLLRLCVHLVKVSSLSLAVYWCQKLVTFFVAPSFGTYVCTAQAYVIGLMHGHMMLTTKFSCPVCALLYVNSITFKVRGRYSGL